MKTTIPQQTKEKLQIYFDEYFEGMKDLGQTDDKKEHKQTINCIHRVFDGFEIGVQYCSPEHFGDSPSFYWFVINESLYE